MCESTQKTLKGNTYCGAFFCLFACFLVPSKNAIKIRWERKIFSFLVNTETTLNTKLTWSSSLEISLCPTSILSANLWVSRAPPHVPLVLMKIPTEGLLELLGRIGWWEGRDRVQVFLTFSHEWEKKYQVLDQWLILSFPWAIPTITAAPSWARPWGVKSTVQRGGHGA